MENERKLLVVDDDEAICQYICETAELCGYEPGYVVDGKTLDHALEPTPHLIVLDLVMPGMDGIEVLRMLSEKKISSGIILSSGFDRRVLKSASLLANELGLNIVGSLLKPFRIEEIIELLEKEKTVNTNHVRHRFEVDASKIDEAIKSNQFEAFFQPKIEMSTGQIAGCEALVRWDHPVEGMISPADFIPFAEYSGQINDITGIVIEQGLAMLKQAKKFREDFKLAINVPANLLIDIGFTDRLIDQLSESNIGPGSIIIEVTESDIMNELSSGLDVVTRLRMKGVHLSIDDFGTGHSSMERLANIPFTELKLDRSFVSEISDDSARKIINNSIKLGHDLGMSVIAEGVEDRETYNELVDLGCDEVQGYYIARPMCSHDFFNWAEKYMQTIEPCVDTSIRV